MKILFGITTGSDSLEVLHRTVERAQSVGDELTVAVLDQPDGEGSADETDTAVRDAIGSASSDIEIRRVEGHPG
ncbi:MAG: universal stress protein, partial [Halodesulfurarchaeum sp.]|nr:universal stress protein [Halodesulfurarchaeum sp.]